VNTKQPQSIISNLFRNKSQAIAAEILFLLFAGVFGALVQHYIKMPMHLPGKQGLLFMLILTSCASLSGLKGAGSIASSGAALYFLLFQMSGGDLFRPFLLILVGISLDAGMVLWRKFNKPLLLLGLVGALSWAVVPVARIFIASFTGIFYKSFASGIIYPVATHMFFGFLAAFVAAIALRKFHK